MTTATGILPDQKLEKQIEKQMGCMTGFLQIFDRHQILAGKRLYATKRLTPSPAGDSTLLSEKSVGSPMDSRELHPQAPLIRSPVTAVPEIAKEIPVRMVSSSPLHQVFDVKESLQRTTTTPWKFREAPRLSLDSRATVDGKGSLYPKEIRTNSAAAAIFSATRCQTFVEENDTQRRSSPSVIAKLMGLEALPDTGGREPIKKVELRRSASESRVSRDLRFDETLRSNFSSNCMRDNNVVVAEDHRSKARFMDSSMEFGSRNLKSEPQRSSSCFVNHPSHQWNSHQQQQRKSFYDSHQDFFPEPKQNGSLYGEIEKRLKMRGIDEPEKDLETLKQILEALQLKGLLHSKKPAERITNRNFVFDRRFSSDESPIVIMKPARSNNWIGRGGPESSLSNFRSKGGINRNSGDQNLCLGRSRLNRAHIEQNQQKEKERRSPGNSRSPDRNENNVAKSPSSLARRRQLNIDTQRRGNIDSRSPIHSPKVISPRKTGSADQYSMNNNKSPRNRKPNISHDVRIFNQGDDDSSAISESSFSTSSQIDTEVFQRTKMEDYKEGRSLLERCDKLLHSIAEITSSETTTDLQPSPVSVLDSSFYKDESSPSPVLRRRCIDFKDHHHHHHHQSMELDDEMWSPMISPMRMKFEEISSSEQQDSDFIYVSEILRVSECISDDNTDVFLLLEKRRSITSSNSKVTNKVHRRLVFDTITEILDRRITQLPPWKTLSMKSSGSLFKQVWSEFEKIRERESTDQDLFEVICGALKKDMAGDAINGWVDSPVETSEAVLDIERLIFKDLVAETIRDLADFAGKTVSSSSSQAPVPRRSLVF